MIGFSRPPLRRRLQEEAVTIINFESAIQSTLTRLNDEHSHTSRAWGPAVQAVAATVETTVIELVTERCVLRVRFCASE